MKAKKSQAKKAPVKKAIVRKSGAKTQRQLKPNRVEMWFSQIENSLIEKAASIKGLNRKAYCEALVLHVSNQLVKNKSSKK